MHLRVSSPGLELNENEIDRIAADLEKIDRRLGNTDEVYGEVRVNNSSGAPGFNITLEIDYGSTHLVATARHGDMGQAVREAREDILRQINDRSRGGHSSFAKRT